MATRGAGFRKIKTLQQWMSPRLQIRFELPIGQELRIYCPDGERFVTFVELGQRVAYERQQAEQERQRAERLALRLRALGIDPDSE